MVQKEQKRRGRPPAYVPELALSKAIKAFWPAGFAGTSLDELADATGMNRPSLYGAFGDKHDLYMKSLEHYWAAGRDAMAKALAPDCPIRAALRAVYTEALDIYFPPTDIPRGCFLIGTGTTEAMHDPDVRAYLAAAFGDIDAAFEARLRLARDAGELAPRADPAMLAKLAGAVLHSLAIRSRAGAPRADLEQFADGAVDLICGPPIAPATSAPTQPRHGRG
jgi:TetR/AcrR family transcriptional regulator, copper-responsive repressor